MGKTLYSFMMHDQVVAALDREAHLRGVSRSELVNQILAEHLSVSTPEMQIRSIFSQMEDCLRFSDLIPTLLPNRRTMAFKSALAYKYRPTLKYEVELYRANGAQIGVLNVTYRTQVRELSIAIMEFCRLWQRIEERAGVAAEYALEEGRFLRTIPQYNAKSEALGAALAAYVRLFDTQLKAFLAGEADERSIASAYHRAMAE